MTEESREQRDARLGITGGPALEPVRKKGNGLTILVLGVGLLAAFAGGVLLGYTVKPEPELGARMFAEIERGCIPFPVGDPQVGPTRDAVNSELHRQAEQFPDNRTERFVAPIPPGPVKDAFPDHKFIGAVIVYACLGDG